MLGADGRPNFRTRSPHVKSRPDIRQEARGREGFGSGQDGDVGGHPPHRPERDSETKCKEGAGCRRCVRKMRRPMASSRSLQR